jgi:hypothetical protein
VLCSIIAGMNDGIRGFWEAKNAGEKIVELLSISYGVAGILALAAWRVRPSWFFFTLIGWAILVEACGTFAATFYAEEVRWIAGISAALSCAAILAPLLIFVRKENLKKLSEISQHRKLD